MTAPEDPPLARSIGAFFGHIVDAIAVIGSINVIAAELDR